MGKGRPKGKTEKDPFKDLSEDFKDSTAAMPSDKVMGVVAQVSLDQVALDNARDADADLAQAKEAAKIAGEVYSDGAKQNKLKVRWLRRILKDRGEKTPLSLQEN